VAASEEELRGFEEPVAVFASEKEAFSLPEQHFPNVAHVRCLKGCRYVPAKAALGTGGDIRAALAGF
jgi:hypothetical protein